MKRQSRNLIPGAKVIISDHALKRYLIRCEILTEEEYNELIALVGSGDKDAINELNDHRKTLEKKFRNSALAKFIDNGKEIRHERGGSKVTRCNFIAKKSGKTFTLITSFLQGKRDSHWKVGIEREEFNCG